MHRRSRPALVLALVLLGPLLAPASGADEPTPVAAFDVFSADPSGVDMTLDAGTTYEVKVSGKYFYGLLTKQLGFHNGEADAECHNFSNGTPLVRSGYDVVLGDGTLDLLIAGQDVEFAPESGSPTGCDDPLFGGDHTYTTTFTPSTGTVNFRIFDPANPRDNAGFLHVEVFPFSPEPPPEPEPVFVPVSTVLVDAADPDGATTATPLSAGETYRLEASGTWNYGGPGDEADVECSTVSSDPAWTPDRYGLLHGENWLDLLVDEASLDWAPVQEVDPDCDSTGHEYTAEIVPQETGVVGFRLLDSFYRDNEGLLRVDVSLVLTPGGG